VLALATVGFFFYVANFSNYNATYGSIGGVIVLLLWIWIGNISLLLGAEFDAEMERARELQAGIVAEESLQLPPRDSKGSKKKLAALEKDIENGRELRTGEPAGPDERIPTHAPKSDKAAWAVLAAGGVAATVAAVVFGKKE